MQPGHRGRQAEGVDAGAAEGMGSAPGVWRKSHLIASGLRSLMPGGEGQGGAVDERSGCRRCAQGWWTRVV